jgi:hypothetical protein
LKQISLFLRIWRIFLNAIVSDRGYI